MDGASSSVVPPKHRLGRRTDEQAVYRTLVDGPRVDGAGSIHRLQRLLDLYCSVAVAGTDPGHEHALPDHFLEKERPQRRRRLPLRVQKLQRRTAGEVGI